MKDEIIRILKTLGLKIKTEKLSLTKNSTKEGAQLKTYADKLAHDFLIKELKKIKDIPIVSEEDKASHQTNKNLFWLIDPIDGTSSLAEGYPGWVIQVALIENNNICFSAVHSPELDLTYYAILNEGSFLNEKRIFVSESLNERILIDNYPSPRGIAKEIYSSLECTKYIESGSIGLKICRVAEGVANLFIKDVAVRDWDVLPPLLILKEAGGSLTKLDGSPYNLSGNIEKNGIIAASNYNYIKEIINLRSIN